MPTSSFVLSVEWVSFVTKRYTGDTEWDTFQFYGVECGKLLWTEIHVQVFLTRHT